MYVVTCLCHLLRAYRALALKHHPDKALQHCRWAVKMGRAGAASAHVTAASGGIEASLKAAANEVFGFLSAAHEELTNSISRSKVRHPHTPWHLAIVWRVSLCTCRMGCLACWHGHKRSSKQLAGLRHSTATCPRAAATVNAQHIRESGKVCKHVVLSVVLSLCGSAPDLQLDRDLRTEEQLYSNSSSTYGNRGRPASYTYSHGGRRAPDYGYDDLFRNTRPSAYGGSSSGGRTGAGAQQQGSYGGAGSSRASGSGGGQNKWYEESYWADPEDEPEPSDEDEYQYSYGGGGGGYHYRSKY